MHLGSNSIEYLPQTTVSDSADITFTTEPATYLSAASFVK